MELLGERLVLTGVTIEEAAVLLQMVFLVICAKSLSPLLPVPSQESVDTLKKLGPHFSLGWLLVAIPQKIRRGVNHLSF
jgi:hypothetical protein